MWREPTQECVTGLPRNAKINLPRNVEIDLPRNVEGRPRGRPSLKGKLWMPGDSSTGTPPVSPE